jgi:hypothetical protein
VIRIGQHISDDSWRTLVDQARQAVEHDEKRSMLLRLPSQLCSDRGRAINAARADWPQKLRGEAAKVYLRWERDLKPYGFGISANVLDFPGGMPGDIGLFLVWGYDPPIGSGNRNAAYATRCCSPAEPTRRGAVHAAAVRRTPCEHKARGLDLVAS